MISTPFDLTGKRVFVAGHRGMVGSALMRRLERENVDVRTVDRQHVDLRDQAAVNCWIETVKPEVIFLAAAKVGGIFANNRYPADFLYDNLMIEANVIHAAYELGVEKLLLLGSTCIYPKLSPQPITEEALLTGPLEPTNEWYAIAKIAGIKLCQAYRRQHGCDFIAAQPTNLYGPGDNFDLETSHVVPALMRKAHEAKRLAKPSMTVWGTGTPLREFLHVDDLADALVFLMKNYSGEMHINCGTGEEISIANLAKMICRTVGYNGGLEFDGTRPDGTPRKLTDVSRINAIGWHHKIELLEGLEGAYQWFLNEAASSLSNEAMTQTR